MNMRLNETTSRQITRNNLIEIGDIDLFRFFIGSHIMILCSLISYGIFYYLSKYPKFYSRISKITDLLKSIFAGLIFSKLSMLTDFEIFFINPSLGLEYHLVSNLPFILILFTFIFTIPLTYCINRFYSKKYKLKEIKTIYRQHHDLINLESFELCDKKGTLTELTLLDKKTKKIFKILKSSKEYLNKRIDIFNTRYFSIIYMLTVCFHSFFSGLGFNGHRYIGWFEIFIFGHKIVEVFRLKRSLDDVNWDKYISFMIVVIFSFLISPIAILLRGAIVSCCGLLGRNQTFKELDNLFIQSFFVINIIETVFPFPKSLLDVALNYILTLVSYFYFKVYLN